MSPTLALRASKVLVHFFGTFADQLISCSGLLIPLNQTHADCEIEVTPYQTVVTLYASTQLNQFYIG